MENSVPNTFKVYYTSRLDLILLFLHIFQYNISYPGLNGRTVKAFVKPRTDRPAAAHDSESKSSSRIKHTLQNGLEIYLLGSVAKGVHEMFANKATIT